MPIEDNDYIIVEAPGFDIIEVTKPVSVVPQSDDIIEVLSENSTFIEVLVDEPEFFEVTDAAPGPKGDEGDIGPPGKFTIGPTAPLDPENGDGWWDNSDGPTGGKTFVYYAPYWVEIGNATVGSDGQDGTSVHVTIATVPPTPSDAGTEGDFWVVT